MNPKMVLYESSNESHCRHFESSQTRERKKNQVQMKRYALVCYWICIIFSKSCLFMTVTLHWAQQNVKVQLWGKKTAQWHQAEPSKFMLFGHVALKRHINFVQHKIYVRDSNKAGFANLWQAKKKKKKPEQKFSGPKQPKKKITHTLYT